MFGVSIPAKAERPFLELGSCVLKFRPSGGMILDVALMRLAILVYSEAASLELKTEIYGGREGQ